MHSRRGDLDHLQHRRRAKFIQRGAWQKRLGGALEMPVATGGAGRWIGVAKFGVCSSAVASVCGGVLLVRQVHGLSLGTTALSKGQKGLADGSRTCGIRQTMDLLIRSLTGEARSTVCCGVIWAAGSKQEKQKCDRAASRSTHVRRSTSHRDKRCSFMCCVRRPRYHIICRRWRHVRQSRLG